MLTTHESTRASDDRIDLTRVTHAPHIIPVTSSRTDGGCSARGLVKLSGEVCNVDVRSTALAVMMWRRDGGRKRWT